VSTIVTGVIDCQVSVSANGKTSAHLKSVFKMSTVCSKSNTGSKTWVPLPDRFIDDHLVEMFPLFDHARLKLVDVTNLAAIWLRYTLSYSFHQIWQSTGLRSGLLAGHRAGVMKSGVSRVTDALSYMLCGLDA